MTSPIRASDILKQDAQGRVPVARREALLDEFERSGSSAMRFARLAGLKYSMFANWVQARHRRRALVRPPSKLRVWARPACGETPFRWRADRVPQIWQQRCITAGTCLP